MSSILAKSALGASLLVLLQVCSRVLTFTVNQVLLRFLSPQCLGAASQLELFSVSVLYFSRESVRVALQRTTNSKSLSIRLSYLAILIGTFLALFSQWLYLRNAGSDLLSIPNFVLAMRLYTLATILELCHEPFFAVAQQQLRYGVRASSEVGATFVRCIVTCAVAFWAHQNRLDLGVLPFAVGQLCHAAVLIFSYIGQVWSQMHWTQEEGTITRPLLHLVAVLYGQSVCKQLLTSGDAYLVALFTSLSAQGVYALAANYGGLLARLLFQPIEEASRQLFARLLPTKESGQPHEAARYLTTLLKCYSLLSLLLVIVAADLMSPILSLVAGPVWAATEVPRVLAAYCWYIPLMAVNGILEAYVSAVADSRQLKVQSTWMVGFSVLFALVGYVVLGILDWGARGLVLSNATIMLGRIIWSARFVSKDLQARGATLDIVQMQPRPATLALTMVGMQVLKNTSDLTQPSIATLAPALAVAAGVCLGALALERAFLLQTYRTFRPMSTSTGAPD